MIQRRALAAGIRTKISAHRFRATGITCLPAERGQAFEDFPMQGGDGGATAAKGQIAVARKGDE